VADKGGVMVEYPITTYYTIKQQELPPELVEIVRKLVKIQTDKLEREIITSFNSCYGFDDWTKSVWPGKSENRYGLISGCTS
jgi:hypothetical protein